MSYFHHIHFSRPSVDNIRVANIGATNLQENKLAQVNDQGARARARWGSALAKNTAGQSSSSSQVGRATNNINIGTHARIPHVRVNKVDATNLQSNHEGQASKRRAPTRTAGCARSPASASSRSFRFDPALVSNRSAIRANVSTARACVASNR